MYNSINCELFRITTGEVNSITIHPGFALKSLRHGRYLNPVSREEQELEFKTAQGEHLFMGIDEEGPPEVEGGLVNEIAVWSGVGRHLPGDRTWAAWAKLTHPWSETDGQFALLSIINHGSTPFAQSYFGRHFEDEGPLTRRQSAYLPTFSVMADETKAGVSLALLAAGESGESIEIPPASALARHTGSINVTYTKQDKLRTGQPKVLA